MRIDQRSSTLAEGNRERLIRWTTTPEFQTLLSICRHRAASALADHARQTFDNKDRILREGNSFQGLDVSLRLAAEWGLVHDKLVEIQAELADGSKTILLGSTIEL